MLMMGTPKLFNFREAGVVVEGDGQLVHMEGIEVYNTPDAVVVNGDSDLRVQRMIHIPHPDERD
jgi:hypothetical protein